MRCGLLGRKLGHSYSPQIHAMLGDYSYSIFEKEPEELEAFLRSGDFDGINVTVPYKQTVIPYLDELTPLAKKLGAVNTVVRRDGKLVGHNTDHFGFLTLLQRSGLTFSGKKVLVLGSGGASHTAVAVLEELGADVTVISRSGKYHYQNLHLHWDAAVIVNTTPVGMYPDTGNSPVDLGSFAQLEGVVDVIYNPARTKLLLEAEKRQIITVNGLPMLVAQAKEAAEWFTSAAISDSVIGPITQKLEAQMQNCILVGMPGCGKSTIGKLIAEITGRKFADSDELIAALAGKSIPEIFEQDGEAVFRQWETQALAELGKQSGLVIATGGGCVTQECNFDLLHQNGTIFWIRRDHRALPTDGRPLSQPERLEEMYRLRAPLYGRFCDESILNDGTIAEAVDRIVQIMEVFQ